MDIDIGKEALKSGTSYVSNKIENVNVNFLRSYFNIDDMYILQKLLMIVFPYDKSKWDNDNQIRVSKPDLYIPVVSLFTYILLKSIYCGVKGNFTPEKIGIIFTRLVIIEVLIVLAVKCVSYVMNIKLKFLDILCYSGYKYFVILLLQLVPGYLYLFVPTCVYGYVSFFFFLSRSLKNSLINDLSCNRSKRLYFLFGFVISQILLIVMLN